MAHSTIPNAGQQYASARKQGANGARLANLKAAARARPRRQESVFTEPVEAVSERIASKNRIHQMRSRRRDS